MKTLIVASAFVCAGLALAAQLVVAPPAAVEPAADRLEMVYFHRAQRCPTCLRVGSLAEEAVTEAFAAGIDSGTVVFRYVDFQDPASAAEVSRYKVTMPTLVAIRVLNHKPVHATKLAKVWALVGKPDALREYVVTGVIDAQSAKVE